MSYLIKSPYNNEWDISSSFAHTDSEKLFNSNLKDLGSDWYWSNKEIIYKFNKYGYRMNKELEEVDFDNYFAFFGCSFTTGTGLPLEETYAYKISKIAGVDYVNAAIGGASVDLAHMNFVQMFNNAPKLPKAVIVNWPELTRTCYWAEDKLEFFIVNDNKHDSSPWWKAYQVFLMEQSQIDNRFKTIRQTFQSMCELANIKLFEMTTFQSDPNFHLTHTGIHVVPLNPEEQRNDIEYYNTVYARDIVVRKPMPLAHPGLYFQNSVTRHFFEETR